MSSIKLFLFLIFFTPLSRLYAQADSLLMVYQTAKVPKDRLDALHKLAIFYVFDKQDIVQGERYIQILLADAAKQGDTLKLMNGYNMLGNSKINGNKPDESIAFFNKAVELARQIRDYQNEAIMLKNLSNGYAELGNVVAQYEALETALAVVRKCDCPLAKALVLESIAYVYISILKDNDKGVFWLKEADKYIALLPERDKRVSCGNSHNIADAYFDQGTIDSALHYNKKALACAESIGNTLVLAASYALKSHISQVQKNYQQAIAEAEKAYALAQKIDYSYMRLAVLNPLVAALLATNQREKAQKYLSKMEEILKEYPSLIPIAVIGADAYNNLFNAYLTTDPQRAAAYLKKQKNLQDTINQQVIKNRAAVLAVQSGIALKESENKRLQLEKDKVQQRNRFLLIGLILAAIAVGSLIYLYLKLRHKNTRLNDLNAALTKSNTQMERFTHTLSHDALGYINHILNYATAGQEADNVEEGHYATLKIHRYATNLKKMAQNLIQFNKTGFFARPETVVLSELIAEVSQDMNGDLATNNVTLNNLTAETLVYTDRELLKQVLRNLTHNAVKFRRPDVPSVLDIKAVEKENEVEVSVADNGIGIASEQLHLVFNEFTKLNKQAEGSGLGLFISKQIVERLGGQIWVESTIGQGSTFYFTLPKVENTPPQ
jgi:signal transduction histidine kinase